MPDLYTGGTSFVLFFSIVVFREEGDGFGRWHGICEGFWVMFVSIQLRRVMKLRRGMWSRRNVARGSGFIGSAFRDPALCGLLE